MNDNNRKIELGKKEMLEVKKMFYLQNAFLIRILNWIFSQADELYA